MFTFFFVTMGFSQRCKATDLLKTFGQSLKLFRVNVVSAEQAFSQKLVFVFIVQFTPKPYSNYLGAHIRV